MYRSLWSQSFIATHRPLWVLKARNGRKTATARWVSPIITMWWGNGRERNGVVHMLWQRQNGRSEGSEE